MYILNFLPRNLKIPLREIFWCFDEQIDFFAVNFILTD